MSLQVIFEYDEVEEKWEVIVKGAENGTEAYQTLNAVAVTCESIITTGSHEAIERLQGGFTIIPTVLG